MIQNPGDLLETRLSRYRQEVMRWNESFSLVSRSGTEARIEALVEEARASFDLLMDRILCSTASPLQGVPRGVHYLDLGSGAGFPGLVWHLLLQTHGLPGWNHRSSLLVEPRHKRAWFLERMIQILEITNCSVGEDQWGARTALRSAPPGTPVLAFITLKALHLRDDDIIAGWVKYRGGRQDSVAICRFHPAATPLDVALREKLGLPAEEGGAPVGATPWARLFGFEASAGPGSLLVSVYPRL